MLGVDSEEGDIAQLGERGVRNAEVGGARPPISTKSTNKCERFPTHFERLLMYRSQASVYG